MELSKLMGCVKRPFIPSELFRDGLIDGAWFDPSDMTTLYQDAAGTTPVTAAEQPVGLMIDKSRGLMLGPELVSNGAFDSDTEWTKGAGWVISNGVASMPSAQGETSNLSQSTGFIAGKTYLITANITITSGSMTIYVVGNNGGSITSSGIKTFRITANASGGFAVVAYAGFTGSIDNISVRELYGYHATQSITASRPTLSARYNLLTKTEDFADAAAWGSEINLTTTSNTAIAPDGTLTADTLTTTVVTHAKFQSFTCSPNTQYTFSFYAKRGTMTDAKYSVYDLTGAANIVAATSYYSALNADTFSRVSITFTTPANCVSCRVYPLRDSGVIGTIHVWGSDVRLGLSGPYQRVNTSTDYDTDERYFPKYLRFDGVDDYLDLPYMGLYAGGSASVVMGISRAKAGAVKYAITEGNPAGGKNYIPFRLSDTGVSSRIINDAGTAVVLTPESAGSASSLPEVLSFKDTGNALTLHKNSSQTNLTNYTRAGSLTLNNLTVGAIVQASVTENMLANLYGLIITKSALTDSQRIACERYLGRKSGVQL